MLAQPMLTAKDASRFVLIRVYIPSGEDLQTILSNTQ